MKIICWKSRATKATGRGTAPLDDATAKKEIDRLTKEYPELEHWAEEVGP